MQHTTTRRGFTQTAKKAFTEQRIIAELVSASSTHAVTQQQTLKTLKKFQGLSYLTTTRGFTLIELLVVVLIIGILAAVALPQYNKAVKKAQSREIMVALDALDKGFTAYYLTNGGPEGKITSEDLDIALPELRHSFYKCESIDYHDPCDNSTTVADILKKRKGEDGINAAHWSSEIKVGSTSFWWKWTEQGTFRYCSPFCSDKSKCPPCEDYVNCTFMQVGTSTRCTF